MGFWPCSCSPSSDEKILQMAKFTFGGNAPNGNSYGFSEGGDGTRDLNDDGTWDIDCSHQRKGRKGSSLLLAHLFKSVNPRKSGKSGDTILNSMSPGIRYGVPDLRGFTFLFL